MEPMLLKEGTLPVKKGGDPPGVTTGSTNEASTRITFNHYTSTGPPPDTFGSVGDISFDFQAGAVYLKLEAHWQQWQGPLPDTLDQQIVHPWFPKRVLWVSETTANWVEWRTLRTNRSAARRAGHDLTVRGMLDRFHKYHFSPGNFRTGKRKLYEESSLDAAKRSRTEVSIAPPPPPEAIFGRGTHTLEGATAFPNSPEYMRGTSINMHMGVSKQLDGQNSSLQLPCVEVLIAKFTKATNSSQPTSTGAFHFTPAIFSDAGNRINSPSYQHSDNSIPPRELPEDSNDPSTAHALSEMSRISSITPTSTEWDTSHSAENLSVGLIDADMDSEIPSGREHPRSSEREQESSFVDRLQEVLDKATEALRDTEAKMQMEREAMASEFQKKLEEVVHHMQGLEVTKRSLQQTESATAGPESPESSAIPAHGLSPAAPPSMDQNRASWFTKNREGSEFPLGTPTISFPDGISEVFVPFSHKDPRQDHDAKAVRLMSEAPSAVSGLDPAVEVLEVPKAMFDLPRPHDPTYDVRVREIVLYRCQLSDTIRQKLAMNRPIIVRGWSPDAPVPFTLEGVKSFRGSLQQPVQVQDAHMRMEEATSRKKTKNGPADIHQYVDLETFIRDAENPEKCQNYMDSPEFRGTAPFFISDVADDTKSYQVTVDNSYTEYPIPRDDDHGVKWKKNLKAQVVRGMQVIPYDMWRLLSWHLYTHGGYYTYPHHDANGYATWILVRSGCKIWGLIVPTVTDDHDTRPKLFKFFRKLLTSPGVHEYRKHSKLSTIALEEGDVFIQPPGYWHEVYTPVKSIVSGGHFLCYDTLHLTEQCRVLASTSALTSTNAEHPGIDRALSRMAIALPIMGQGRRIPLRPIAALRAMLKDPAKYKSQANKNTPESHDILYVPKTDFLGLESEAERLAGLKIAESILCSTGASDDTLRELVERAGPGWCHPGDVVLEDQHLLKAASLM
ncbi:hypothetical protein PLICRDRAFT_29715 [Plicaturopsis crispa FD-325 SS-3]|nr:hypothetical protein PLICRDRAFT_29715 [Plicaturopsis crispa FD-325 SS-3]